LLHRAMVWAKRTCLRRAAAVVSLTHAAVEHLQAIYPQALQGQRIAVIPTCADLERFVPASGEIVGVQQAQATTIQPALISLCDPARVHRRAQDFASEIAACRYLELLV